jgi:hypothetical protein
VADKKPLAITAWIAPLIVGVLGVLRVTHSQSFNLYRTVDVVQLLASGACFGATLVGVILMVRPSRV